MRLAGRQVPGWLVRVGQFAVAGATLALLWRTVDGPAAARSLAAADLRWLGLAWLALGLQTVFCALRWRLTARQLGIGIGAGRAIAEYYLSQVVNQSLPGGMIGDAGRAVRSRGAAGLKAAGQAVIFERLAGQVAMFALFAVAFVVTLALPGGLDWPRWLAVPVGLFVAGGLALPLLAELARFLPGAPGRAVLGLRRALHTALAAPAVWPAQVALSVGTTLCILAAFAFCARAVGVTLDLAAITALVPLILFTMLIPISVSGWGLREGAAAALLPLAGAAASDGLAASVAFGLTFIAAVLPGVLALPLKPPAQPEETARTGTPG
jgi:uncharacterized membrane protein YbhN (UPF0104 family)